MLKLFIKLNARLFWHSLTKTEVVAMIFYSLFMALLAWPALQGVYLISSVSDVSEIQQTFPWLNDDLFLLIQLAIVNTIWIGQLLLVKPGRLRIEENRKLLAMGYPLGKLANYLNAAGLFHPMNLFFHLLWFLYLGNRAETTRHILLITALIVVNYGLISSFKWRFRIVFSNHLKWVNSFLLLILIFAIFLAPHVDLSALPAFVENHAIQIAQWLSILPGGLLLSVTTFSTASVSFWVTAVLLLTALYFLHKDLTVQSISALQTPVSEKFQITSKNTLLRFKKLFGIDGGKFLFYVWSHPYTKMQLLSIALIPAFYAWVMTGGERDNSGLIAFFIALIPAGFLMYAIPNMFGFEAREFLLIKQLPRPLNEVIRERIISSCKVIGVLIIPAVLIMAILFTDPLKIIHLTLGMIFLLLVCTHMAIWSSYNSYKKVVYTGFSFSSPVVPTSVGFMNLVVAGFIGVIAFAGFIPVGYHIALLAALSLYLTFLLLNKLKTLDEKFKIHILPQLWNEL